MQEQQEPHHQDLKQQQRLGHSGQASAVHQHCPDTSPLQEMVAARTRLQVSAGSPPLMQDHHTDSPVAHPAGAQHRPESASQSVLQKSSDSSAGFLEDLFRCPLTKVEAFTSEAPSCNSPASISPVPAPALHLHQPFLTLQLADQSVEHKHDMSVCWH